jgi:hypothetical protein
MESNDTSYVDILFTMHPFIRSTMQDKIIGTMVGSAVGDAIGLYTGATLIFFFFLPHFAFTSFLFHFWL